MRRDTAVLWGGRARGTAVIWLPPVNEPAARKLVVQRNFPPAAGVQSAVKRLCVSLFACTVSLLLCNSIARSATTGGTRPAILHLAFGRQGDAGGLMGRGRYVFISDPVSRPGSNQPPNEQYSGGTLVDDRSGRQIRISAAGCVGVVSGGPWVMFSCGPAARWPYALYSIPRRASRGVSVPQNDRPWAIGRYWLQYWRPATGDFAFQNLETGAVRTLGPWQPGGTIVPDLDLPSLARHLCAPLRVPMEWTRGQDVNSRPRYYLNPGTVTYLGKVAFVQGTSRPDAAGDVVDESYLERCGSRAKRSIKGVDQFPVNVGDWRANSHMIITGNVGDGSLTGYEIPSLRPIRIPVPGYRQGLTRPPYQIVLGARNLYLVDSNEALWVAPLPVSLR